MKVRPVVLCGGSGTRLWPLSVPSKPKQFQSLVTERSLLAETIARLSQPGAHEGDLLFDRPLIVGSKRHASAIAEACPDADVILEPFGRDSAPAIAAAALASDPETVLLVLPADHHIRMPRAFLEAIATGYEAARQGSFVTFGIEPDHPSTAYGYIKSSPRTGGTHAVDRFVEKPDRATAESYLAEGHYYWNAGIFLFRASAMVDALMSCDPAIIEAVSQALPAPGGRTRSLDPGHFARSPAISIDYAVMEPLSLQGKVVVVPVDMGWSDIGDHRAVHAASEQDAAGVTRKGPVTTEDVQRASLFSSGPMVAAIGVSDIAVIATPGSVLVADLEKTQAVKDIAKAANGFGYGFLLPEETRERVRTWLFDTALPAWADHAWDEEHEGFKEALNFETFAEESPFRRSRVQMRQIYAFAHARTLGWDGPAKDLVGRGIDHLMNRWWREDRGFVHRQTPAGAVVDDRMDAYDHAFALTAIAWAHRAGLLENARPEAERITALVDRRLALPEGGFADDDTGNTRLRSNPHMHYLEAFLALFEAFGDPVWLGRAEEMVLLFEAYFFDPRHDCVIEHFGRGWAACEERGDRIEPGHAYEWASLLAKFEKHSGRDLASWRRRLIASADRHGRDPATGFALNAISRTGERIDPSRRLWPQTEMLRARIVEPAQDGLAEATRLLDALFATYLTDARPGFLMDSYDEAGQASAPNIPASMLYHLVSAFAPIINNSKA